MVSSKNPHQIQSGLELKRVFSFILLRQYSKWGKPGSIYFLHTLILILISIHSYTIYLFLCFSYLFNYLRIYRQNVGHAVHIFLSVTLNVSFWIAPTSLRCPRRLEFTIFLISVLSVYRTYVWIYCLLSFTIYFLDLITLNRLITTSAPANFSSLSLSQYSGKVCQQIYL